MIKRVVKINKLKAPIAKSNARQEKSNNANVFSERLKVIVNHGTYHLLLKEWE
jgi:hypothetical protein